MAIFPGSAIPSAVSDYEIENSVRFDDGSSPLLRRTPTATGDRQKMTWSAWVKLGKGEITIDSAAEESVCPKEWGGAFKLIPVSKEKIF